MNPVQNIFGNNQLSSGTNSTLNTGLIGTSNCTIWPYTYTPHTTYVYSTPSTEPHYSIKLRQVENGWVMLKDGKEYIISDVKEILKYLKDK